MATQTTVHANDAIALEKTLESSDVLVTNDSVVLGSVSKANPEESASLSLLGKRECINFRISIH